MMHWLSALLIRAIAVLVLCTALAPQTVFAGYHSPNLNGNSPQDHYENNPWLSDDSWLEENSPQAVPTPCSEQAIDPSLPWLDRTHLALSQSVCNTARWFDRFFGDVRYDDNFASSFVRVRNNFVIEDDQDTEYRFEPRLRARVHLPNAKERINLIISDDSEDETSLSTAQEQLAIDSEEPNRYSTTVRWVTEKRSDLEIDFDIGARFNDQLQMFVRNRFRKTYNIDDQRLWRLTGEFFWRDLVGFGERTLLDYEYRVNKDWFFRLGNSMTFSESSRGVDWTQRYTLWQYLNLRTAISYGFAATGYTRPTSIVENYGFSVRYRRQIYSHWLFAEVEPQLNWPYEDDRDIEPRIILRLEVQLGYD